jgi:type I restriction enzyme S subunit
LNFSYILFQRIDWKQKDESTGVPSLSKATISSIDVFAPGSAEQKRLGALFASVDNLITLHQRKLIALNNIRQTCLEKMFAF